MIEVGGGTARDHARRRDRRAICTEPADVTTGVARAGEVGSQVKMRVGELWLVANVRSLRLDDADDAA